MHSLWRDAVYAARLLKRAPGFSIVVVTTLALGIGANAAIFSVVDAVLLTPLPFPEADRLVVVWESRFDDANETMFASPPNYADWRERSGSFDEIGAFVPRDYFLVQDDGAVRVRGARVTASLFPTLGVAPVLGRTLLPGDDRPGAEPVALIGHELWRSEYGGDPGVVNRSIRLGDGIYRVVGVMPAGFDFPPAIDLHGRSAARDTELWVPFATDFSAAGRGAHYMTVVGRLGPDVTLERAGEEMDALAAALAERHPETNGEWGVRLVRLSDAVAGEVRTALMVLLGAVGVLLLIACVNVANLLVARAMDREREFAIRTALGAGRGSLVRQALVESQLLALAGGVVGLALAVGTVAALVRFAPRDVPRLAEASIDPMVLAFTLALSVATGLIFGLAPVLGTRSAGLAAVLKAGGRSGGDNAGRSRLRNGLVVTEVALSVVLLVGGGLLFRSFLSLRGVDTGVVAERVITMRLNLPASAYPEDERVAATFQELERRVRSLPDVASAGFTAEVPLAAEFQGTLLQVENVPSPPDERWLSHFSVVTPGYFEAMGVPVAAGRAFDARDGTGGTPAVIVNRAIVRRYLRGRDPLGLRVLFGEPRTVVGVVGDVRLETLRDEPTPAFYLPHAQVGGYRSMSLVVRHRGEHAAVLGAVRDAIGSVDRTLPVYDVRTMDQILGERLGRPRFSAFMLLAFSALALVLAGVGIYGVIAYLVSRRTREMGLRMALGASPGQARALVVREGLRLVAIGLGIGLPAAFAASRLLESQLYRVAPTDPVVFAGVSAFLVLVGLAASALPAARAAAVQPMEALRYE